MLLVYERCVVTQSSEGRMKSANVSLYSDVIIKTSLSSVATVLNGANERALSSSAVGEFINFTFYFTEIFHLN